MKVAGKIGYICEGDVAIITIADPATLNALSVTLAQELAEALTLAAATSRAIILTGEGRSFCSGANLSDGIDPTKEGYDAGEPLEAVYNPLMQSIRNLAVPIVTAIRGAAAGFGCALALSGDMIVAGQHAYFMQAFRRVALVPDGGSAWFLMRGAGRARAMEMMLLGERLPATQALEWGLINRVVPEEEVMNHARIIAERLASGPTAALRMTRELGWSALACDFDEQLAQERVLQAEAGRLADHREGIAAFLTNRPAHFTGA